MNDCIIAIPSLDLQGESWYISDTPRTLQARKRRCPCIEYERISKRPRPTCAGREHCCLNQCDGRSQHVVKDNLRMALHQLVKESEVSNEHTPCILC